jgi:flagellar biosynthesis GTPase FlhF
MIREVMAERRQLRRNENAALARQQTGAAITEPSSSPMGRWGTVAVSTSRIADRKSAERGPPPEYMEDYQRTMGYIRSSLRSPALRQPSELNITGTDLNSSRGVESASMGTTKFADEVKRFNRMRLLVQNTGQHFLEMEKKRFDVLNQQHQKEERLQTALRIRDKKREQARRALKYEEEEKLERVKEKIKEEEAARRQKVREMMEEDKRKYQRESASLNCWVELKSSEMNGIATTCR